MSKEAEKFIEKYTTKDQNDWLVEKKDIIARFMESYHTEQLSIDLAVRLSLLQKVREISFSDGSAQERMVDIKALFSNEA